MGRRLASRAWISVLLLLLLVPSLASAGEGLHRPVAGVIALRFGAAFSSAGKQCTHRGVDILADPGEMVLAPAGGVVTFAGEVPADGGGRTVAVTVTTDDGLLVCVMPLERANVRTGDSVIAGTRMGVVAGAGDPSSADPHVHMSVRNAGAYVDPEPLLGALEAATEPVSAAGGSNAEPADGSAVSPGMPATIRAGARASASPAQPTRIDPLLTPAQVGAIRQAFSAEIGRMRSGHGQLRASGFREPTLADTVRAAIPRPHVVMPVGSVGAALIGMVALGGMFVRKLHSGAEMARAGLREL